ncbi:hypothetical protein CABS01_02986 [Colletotrichum abscissum]|uniref:Uncharacterized protein n=2 Tax=Colletotrichum acutatum species complex TaxID=2707335 RepID=A0AAJ0E4J6_9PEZI|nr:uncharacterized protein CCOS01_04549 [Colletotrichum costaricense]XP_060388695.1 uncharacterized protein CTAM01_00015 [Colletotrichum tamarilloi]XP_060394275.1 uncharacterized protein CABS01_02986 [Colletotrichum abscissum]KAI3527988.1 hypothetical protein CSPX01_16552 [Colletotrichum filicis]KAK1483250.1 hypothetical protein CABS01_02986 [Colletotrichum abscissum]KAK1512620.1 hypothetical protein CTAM01_00015 [Colletotrichum tamarilloi]KAK1532566.1 hypothetical protein CCOS01_04549 [Colle
MIPERERVLVVQRLHLASCASWTRWLSDRCRLASSKWLLHYFQCNRTPAKCENRKFRLRETMCQPTAGHLSGDDALMAPHRNPNQCLFTWLSNCMASSSNIKSPTAPHFSITTAVSVRICKASLLPPQGFAAVPDPR